MVYNPRNHHLLNKFSLASADLLVSHNPERRQNQAICHSSAPNPSDVSLALAHLPGPKPTCTNGGLSHDVELDAATYSSSSIPYSTFVASFRRHETGRKKDRHTNTPTGFFPPQREPRQMWPQRRCNKTQIVCIVAVHDGREHQVYQHVCDFRLLGQLRINRSKEHRNHRITDINNNSSKCCRTHHPLCLSCHIKHSDCRCHTTTRKTQGTHT